MRFFKTYKSVFPLLLFCIIGTVPVVTAQELEYQPPRIEGFHPLDEREHVGNPLTSKHAALLLYNSKVFYDRQEIDFEKRQIKFSRVDSLGFAIWEYQYNELSDYLSSRQRYVLFKGWYDGLDQRLKGQAAKPSAPSLEFALPVQYPSWAQRILGKEPPKLTITGSLTITISYDDARQEPPSSQGEVKGAGFQFMQENSFTITGTIGRLISINIKASSEEGFDVENPLKNFKIEYKGEGDELEDEIIQEIVAGYTGFDMPGTQLSGYSEHHDGLFGIKIRTKFGPLELTTIASNEQGETQKLTKSSGGAAGGATSQFTEDRFIKYKFFFVDSVYLKQYLKRSAGRSDTLARLPVIKNIQVWVQVDQQEISQNLSGRYRYSGDNWPYKQIVEGDGLYVDRVHGWIRLDSMNVDQSKRVAIFLRTDDSTLVSNKGDTTLIDSTKNQRAPHLTSLGLLKDENPDPTQPTYWLAWRNVYALPKNIDAQNFTFKIRQAITGRVDTQDVAPAGTPQAGKLFSWILGLTDNSGKALLQQQVFGQKIFDDVNGYLIIPPFANPTIGNQPFRNPDLVEIDTSIYTVSDQNYTSGKINDPPKYLLMMSGTTDTKTTRYDLGWGVMKGTELVKADGAVLTRDRDYIIDYESGTLELTSKPAIAAKNIAIEYQREALFVPEKKVFLGARGEVKLPFISENSFLGASVLYQNASIRENIPVIGREPFSKLILDFNTKIDLEPEWMTTLIDKLPLISTQAPSKVTVEFEVANSQITPNTKGEAYVDDFEAAKQVYPLGESQLTWHQASPPVDLLDTLAKAPPAWLAYWFNPVDEDDKHRVLRDSIWELDAANRPTTQQDLYEHVLHWECQPAPPGPPELKRRYKRPWAGIMTSIPSSFADRSKDKYLEFWARSRDGGKLYVDMGILSEHLCIDGNAPDPNERGRTEDTTEMYTTYNADQDLGLDNLPDSKENYYVPDSTNTGFTPLFDLSKDSTQQQFLWSEMDPFPPVLNHNDRGRDNWALYDNNNLNNFRFVNGLEKDQRLTSEDINLDGYYQSSSRECFFRAVIDFNKLQQVNYDITKLDNSNYLEPNSNAKPNRGWHLYRIPLRSLMDSTKMVKSPSGDVPAWDKIKFVRLWWSDFDSTRMTTANILELTQIQFVGNQWQEVSAVTTDTTKKDSTIKTGTTPLPLKIDASVVNTDDDQVYREMRDNGQLPFTVERDANNNFRRAQGLRMIFNGLVAGDTALVERIYNYQPLNLSSYHTLSMYVYGSSSFDNVYFVFRFGTNSGSYYEYHTDAIYSGWDRRNWVSIDLQDLANLKLAYFNRKGDTVTTIDTVVPNGHYAIHSTKNIPPSFSSVTWMAVGIVRPPNSWGPPVSGEVWVDEMKVAGIKALNGWAARAAVSTQWADFMGVSLGANYQDADFRTMTATQLAAGNSSIDGNLRVDWKMDKFLPSTWGVQIPLGTMVSGALTRPQMKPNTDIPLTNSKGESDRLDAMAGDAVEMLTGYNPGEKGQVTAAEHYQTKDVEKQWTTGYDKTAQSKNPLVNLTADRISVNYIYKSSETSKAKGEKIASSKDYIDTDLVKSYSGALKYDLSPRTPPKWTKWKPFGALGAPWFPSLFKNYELSLLPGTLRFNLADVTYTDAYHRLDQPGLDTAYLVKTFGINHGFTLEYSPISPLLQLAYGITIKRQLDREVQTKEGWRQFINQDIFAVDTEWHHYGLLYGETSRNQNASLGFKPQFFDFLTHDFDYKTTYDENVNNIKGDPHEYLNLTVDNTFTFSSKFQFTTFFHSLADITKWAKPISMSFDGVEKGLDKISLRDIIFSYNANSNLKNNMMSRQFLESNSSNFDFLSYQIGKNGRSIYDIMTADMNDDYAFGGMRYRSRLNDVPANYVNDTRSSKRDYSVATSMSLPDPIPISLSTIKLGWAKSYNVKPDTLGWDSTTTFPTVELNATSSVLDKVPLVNKYMQRVGLSSHYIYEKSRKVRPGMPDEVESQKFDPLVLVDGTVRTTPVNVKYRYSMTKENHNGNAITESNTSDNNLDINYEIVQTTKIPELKIFTWSFPIKGKTTMGVVGDILQAKETVAKANSKDDLTMTLEPHVTYEFTNNVVGTLSYSGKRQTENTITNINHLFKLVVKVSF